MPPATPRTLWPGSAAPPPIRPKNAPPPSPCCTTSRPRIQDHLPGRRDALRRSELAAVQLIDLLPTRASISPSSAAQCAQTAPVPAPCGRTELGPVRALTAWLAAAGISEGAVFLRISMPPAPADGPLPCPGSAPRCSAHARSPASCRHARRRFGRLEFGGHSLKRGALTTGMT